MAKAGDIARGVPLSIVTPRGNILRDGDLERVHDGDGAIPVLQLRPMFLRQDFREERLHARRSVHADEIVDRGAKIFALFMRQFDFVIRHLGAIAVPKTSRLQHPCGAGELAPFRDGPRAPRTKCDREGNERERSRNPAMPGLRRTVKTIDQARIHRLAMIPM